MKKTLIFLPLFVLIVLAGTAQGFHLGAKLGANMDKIAGKSFSDEFKLGYHLGGFVEIDFNKNIGIQPELLYSQTNTKEASGLKDIYENIDNALVGDKVKLSYLSIPVLLRINAGELLTFHAGPQFSILMNSNETLLDNGKDAFKKGDLDKHLNIGDSISFTARLNLNIWNGNTSPQLVIKDIL